MVVIDSKTIFLNQQFLRPKTRNAGKVGTVPEEINQPISEKKNPDSEPAPSSDLISHPHAHIHICIYMYNIGRSTSQLLPKSIKHS